MKRFFLLVTLVCASFFTSCELLAPDDSDLMNRMDDFESRLQKLEELCSKMNTNISSLQSIVDAIQKNDQIAAIAPITREGEEVGYTISFTSGKTITVYNGKDGQDGADGKDGRTPVIGVKKDTDGNYYWTVDGEWLTDANGNKIKATANGTGGADGEDGVDGKDGITPQLKIENGYWYVSYDNGATWKQLGKATGEDGKDGEDGDSFFQSVTQDEYNVYFTLADGTVLTVPKKAELALYFDTSSLTEITVNSEVRVDYTVVSSADVVEVEVVPTADLCAEVVADDDSNKTGYILIRTGSSYDTASKVIVFASDGEKAVMKSIALQVIPDTEAAQLYTYNGATKLVAAAGGPVTLSFLTNVDCEAVIPDEASSWISIDQTRALDYKRITLNVVQNTSTEKRSATVKVQSLDGTLSVDYTITQLGATTSGDPDVDDDGNIIGSPAANEIFYTSSDGKVVEPYDPDVFGGIIVSNTYTDGVGVIVFDRAITSVGYRAFFSTYDHLNLTSIVLPEGVTTIGDYAFDDCETLIAITLPNTIKDIGTGAFDGCERLSQINLPYGITKIESTTFQDCSALTAITIPNSVTTIGSSAFQNCKSLVNITIPNGITSIESRAFHNCASLTSITIPDSVTSMESYIFEDCSNLANVHIGTGITKIPEKTFRNCKSLMTINIPDNVSKIEKEAFYSCTILESVTIGSGVKSIGAEAFRYCYMLNNITCKPTTPPTGSEYMFDGIGTTPKIYVPTGSGNAYKTATYWSTYADIIAEKDM